MSRAAILWIAITLFVCCTGGMFFLDALPTLWVVSLSLSASVCMIFMKIYKPANIQDLSVSKSATMIIWGPLFIAGMYAGHLFNNTLSVHATMLSVIGWLFYAAVGVFIYINVGESDTRKRIERGWGIVTGFLAITALAAVYGILPVPYAILRSADPELTANGARLGGLLQYPNTLGAIMGAALVERLMRLARCSDGTGIASISSSQLQRYISGTLTLVFMLCLLLSESRGAYIAAAVGWAVGYLLLPTPQRQRYLLQTGVFAAAGALLSRQLAAAQLAPPLLPGLLVLAAIMAAALALSGLAARCAASTGAARLCRGAALLGMGAALCWIVQHARLLHIDTLSARFVMYKDALKIFIASPWMGQGGDTWKTAYLGIQRSPYAGSEVHSGYIDIALDLGVIGLSIVVCWLGIIFVMLYRRKSMMLAPLIVLLLHSAVDFDMSYGLFWMLALTLAGLGLSSNNMGLPGIIHKRAKQEWILRRGIIYGIMSVIFIAGSLVSFRMSEGLRLYNAFYSGMNLAPDENIKLLRESLTRDPSRTAARMDLAALLPPDKAAALLNQGIDYDRNNDKLWLALGASLARQGDMEAMTALRQAAAMNRFNPGLQTDVLHQMTILALRLKNQQQYEKAREAALAGYEMYENYSRLSEAVKRSSLLRNDREFAMTREAELRSRELGLIALGIMH